MCYRTISVKWKHAFFSIWFTIGKISLLIYLEFLKFYNLLIDIYFFQERDNFISALSECSLPNRIISDMLLSNAVDKWREGHISNWEYLTTLNKMAGRSYNDLMQYPVMPFILADYVHDIIDLRDRTTYRLTKNRFLFIPLYKKNKSDLICNIFIIINKKKKINS